MASGITSRRLIIRKPDNEYFVFPGNYKGNPYAWDAYQSETYETYVASEKSALQIFNPNFDRSSLNMYNSDWRNNSIQYVTGDDPRQLVLKATMAKPTGSNLFGWQTYFGDKINGRKSELPEFNKVVVKGRADTPTKVKLTFISADALSYAAFITLNNTTDETEISLSDFKQDSSLLLPRPYPGFLPLWFKGNGSTPFNFADAEKLEITFGHDLTSAQLNKHASIEIESVWFKKRN